jgi:hypothetical protein
VEGHHGVGPFALFTETGKYRSVALIAFLFQYCSVRWIFLRTSYRRLLPIVVLMVAVP